MRILTFFHLGYNGGEYSATRWRESPVDSNFLSYAGLPQNGHVLKLDGHEWRVFKVVHFGTSDRTAVHVERVTSSPEEFEEYEIDWNRVIGSWGDD